MNALLTAIGRGIALLWRNKWTFAVPVVTLLLPATFYAVSLPDTYEANAVVSVQPLRPGNVDYTLPQVSPDGVDEVMETVRDRIFTRPNVQAALPVVAPDADAEDPRVAEGAAKAYSWEQIGRSAFELSCKQTDPDRAAEAVNVLLTSFLEGERADRLRQAERSVAFHAGEAKEAQTAYDAALDGLDAFRTEHADSLPDRKDSIQAALRQLQTDITTQAGRSVVLRQRVQLLEEQILALLSLPVSAPGARVSATEEMYRLQLAAEQRALNDAEKELANARAKYQERHPDVIQLREAVAVHRASVQETTEALDREREQAADRAADSVDEQVARRRASLVAMKESAETQATQAEERSTVLQHRVEDLHQTLSAIPATKAALSPLLRELEQAEKRKDERDRAATDAQEIAALYRAGDLSDVTGFKVTAWAVPPVEPSGPGRPRYLLTALVLGALIGYGLLILKRRHEGTTVRSPADLEGLFPAAVVVNVPRLGKGPRIAWMARLKGIAIAVYVLLLGGASVYLIAAYKGWVARPEWLQGLIGGGLA